MDLKDQILNDPQCAGYTDIRRGWVHEAFLDGAEYGNRLAVDYAVKWLGSRLGRAGTFPDEAVLEGFLSEFKDAMEE